MIEPRLVSKIVSKYNSVLYETQPKEILDFTKPEQAYLMTTILKDVINKGTGKNAKVEGLELAGKTGTTNNYIDAWFCGYSPTITTIVWYGRDRYKSIKKGATGGKVAAPAFAYFYKKLLELNPNMKREFTMPKGVFVGNVNGYSEYYTNTSPLPQSDPNADIYEESSNIPNTTPKEQQSNSTNIQDITSSQEIDSDSTVIIPIDTTDSEDVEVLY
jgi:penicillin-binding protein 1A